MSSCPETFLGGPTCPHFDVIDNTCIAKKDYPEDDRGCPFAAMLSSLKASDYVKRANGEQDILLGRAPGPRARGYQM